MCFISDTVQTHVPLPTDLMSETLPKLITIYYSRLAVQVVVVSLSGKLREQEKFPS